MSSTLQKLLAQLHRDAASGLISETLLRLAAQVHREAGASPRR